MSTKILGILPGFHFGETKTCYNNPNAKGTARFSRPSAAAAPLIYAMIGRFVFQKKPRFFFITTKQKERLP